MKKYWQEYSDSRMSEIDAIDILDDMNTSEIKEYLENNGVEVLLYSNDDPLQKRTSDLADFVSNAIDDKRAAFNFVLQLDDNTKELLKKELLDN